MAEEIESVGIEQRHAVELLLINIIHTCCRSRHGRRQRPVSHWQHEIDGWRVQVARRLRRSPKLGGRTSLRAGLRPISTRTRCGACIARWTARAPASGGCLPVYARRAAGRILSGLTDMPFRFRRSIRIAPGLRLNPARRGGSASKSASAVRTSRSVIVPPGRGLGSAAIRVETTPAAAAGPAGGVGEGAQCRASSCTTTTPC